MSLGPCLARSCHRKVVGKRRGNSRPNVVVLDTDPSHFKWVGTAGADPRSLGARSPSAQADARAFEPSNSGVASVKLHRTVAARRFRPYKSSPKRRVVATRRETTADRHSHHAERGLVAAWRRNEWRRRVSNLSDTSEPMDTRTKLRHRARLVGICRVAALTLSTGELGISSWAELGAPSGEEGS